MYKLKVETAQAAWAVSVADLKTHLRVTSSEDNDYITALGKAAQALVEAYTSRKFNAITYKMYLDEWPTVIYLPFAPIASVTHVKYYSDSTTLVTWSDYETDLVGEPCRIRPKDGYSYPTHHNMLNAIEVQFVTGGTVPQEAIEAIKLIVGDMYDNRIDAPREKFTAWKSLVYNLKVWT